MSVKCQVIIDAIEKMAPRYLAEEWDNVGLLVGTPSANVNKVLVCLDVTAEVVEQAIAEQVELIVAHHPLIFKPLKNLRTDSYQGKVLTALLKHDIAVYAAHTNLDSADGGVNDVLAAQLGLVDVTGFVSGYKEKLVKLAVYVPVEYADAVRQAIGKAGAGHIGNYSNCSFSSAGQGRFTPQEGADPFIGCVGQAECVAEVKIETILPEKSSARVVRAMLKAHPYEEAAFEILPLKNTGREFGLGRIGRFKAPLTLAQASDFVKNALGLSYVRVVGSLDKEISKVALCGGAGAEFISKAAFGGADLYITGDLKYHEAQKAVELGMSVIDAGHFGTEIPAVKALAAYLVQCGQRDKWRIDIFADTFSRDIIAII